MLEKLRDNLRDFVKENQLAMKIASDNFKKIPL